ncbi:MAG: hypothetical protein ACYTDX_04640 [Planctomycetota bacterium]|jgi:hypothetical protein
MRFTLRGALPLVLAAAVLAGCKGPDKALGAETIYDGRADYNTAIQRTDAEQLLLNLVRLRYRDTTYFLEVSSVSTTFESSGTLGGEGTFVKGAPNPYDAFASFKWSEKPTVTYAPLKGDKFVKQLMTPVNLDTLVLLTQSGWSAERVLGVLLRGMNGLRNAPSASGPTPDIEPEFRKFREAIGIMRTLQQRHALHFGFQERNGQQDLHMRFSEDSTEVRRLCELLGIIRGRPSYPVSVGIGGRPNDRVVLVTRSLMATMFYLSQSVEVSEEDIEEGRVTVTTTESGEVFDWDEVVGHLFRVNSSSDRPKSAYVAVPYRGRWFWIDDGDLTAKSTFSLLSQILALQSGTIETQTPVLTIPVGG